MKFEISEFEQNIDLDIDALPIIISGGTSLPPGFLNKFKHKEGANMRPF